MDRVSTGKDSVMRSARVVILRPITDGIVPPPIVENALIDGEGNYLVDGETNFLVYA